MHSKLETANYRLFTRGRNDNLTERKGWENNKGIKDEKLHKKLKSDLVFESMIRVFLKYMMCTVVTLCYLQNVHLWSL